MSDSSKADSIADIPLIVGVLHIKILRLKNVLVLAVAKDIGDPSPFTLCSKRSISSKKRTRMGLLANPAGDPEEEIVI